MAHDLPPPPEPQSESTLYAHLTEGGRDPVRDQYMKLAGRMAATNPETRLPSPTGTRFLPPWKIL